MLTFVNKTVLNLTLSKWQYLHVLFITVNKSSSRFKRSEHSNIYMIYAYLILLKFKNLGAVMAGRRSTVSVITTAAKKLRNRRPNDFAGNKKMRLSFYLFLTMKKTIFSRGKLLRPDQSLFGFESTTKRWLKFAEILMNFFS